MIVCSRAPRWASWVPTVCRNRCAEIVGLPATSTRPAVWQAAWSLSSTPSLNGP
jgi:hypothetical protein